MTDEGGETSIDAAFSLVADETRVDILQELWDGHREREAPLSFSTLRERVDIRDSGRFNYHLGKLTPRFVRDTEAGYELTHAGKQIIGAVVSGTYTDTDVTVDPIDAGSCPTCDGTVQARYDGGRLEIDCADCDTVITDGLPAPPVLAANHDPEALPEVFNRLLITRVQQANRGFCQLCGGRLDPTLEREDWKQPHVRHNCRECGMEVGMAIPAAVLDHPAVVAFCYDHGVDVREAPVWDLDWLFDGDASVTSEEPLRIEFAIERDGTRLEMTLDETFDVVEHSRHDDGREGADPDT
jgi:hypothetical protein